MGKAATFSFRTVLFCLLALTACSRKPSRTMALYDHIPSGVQHTTLLVQKFTWQNPTVYDSFYSVNTDSLKKAVKFSVDPDVEIKSPDKPVKQMEHPLIVKTNKHLDEYNDKLAKVMKNYNFPYEITDASKIDSNSTYSNLDKYRYVLYRKPVLHCFIDPEGVTQLSYRYTHYFHDRQTGQDFAPIEVFYPNPANSIKAIVERINELATSQNEKKDAVDH